MTRDHPHRALLADWLPRVNQDPRRLEHYQLLTGGVSGSYTYRLRGPDGPSVLKVTQAVSRPYARQRAQREITFYRAGRRTVGRLAPVDFSLASTYNDREKLGAALCSKVS